MYSMDDMQDSEVRKRFLAKQEIELQNMNLSPDEVKRALDPMRSFHQQLEEDQMIELTEKQKNLIDLALSYMGANIKDVMSWSYDKGSSCAVPNSVDDVMSRDLERGFATEKIEGGEITDIRNIIGSKRLSNEHAHEERVWRSGR